MSHPLHYKNKKLYLENIDLDRICRKNRHPVYVYSKKRISEKYNDLKNSFSVPAQILYAMKANSNIEVLRHIQKLGSGVDIVSGGELARAIKAGFGPKKIVYSGVAKSEEEIEFALKQKISLFNVESPQELTRIGELAKRLKTNASVSFRLNPDVDPKTHPYIATGFRENKFGMEKSFMPELVKILRKFSLNLNLCSLDFHIGSQLTGLAPIMSALHKSLKVLVDLRAEGFQIDHIDVGGGVGIPYQDQKVIDIKEYGKKISDLAARYDLKLLTEPGRYIVADAGVLLTKVEYIKKTPHKTFVIVNSGMHHLIRPSLYEAYHRILPVRQSGGRMQKVDVVGPVCESGDFFAKNRPLVVPAQGDWLAVGDAGAYGYVMSSDYNLLPKAKEIVL